VSEGIGKALAIAIKDETEPMPEKRGRHVFLNTHRRRIFSILTANPCMGVVELASECGLAQNTVEWHLDTLIKSGYVVKHSIGRRRVFFPDGLISHDQAGLFQIINHPGHSMVLMDIVEKPGQSQLEIAERLGKSRQHVAKTLEKLESIGIISVVADGTHSRYYPTRLLPEKAEEFYRHSKDFSEYILRRLGQEGGKPPVVVKRGLDRMIVEVGHASERFNLDVGINPYKTCLGC
jgi:DNA-binding MarR family transcriptional regulator